jgi:AraC family transcriptional regulator
MNTAIYDTLRKSIAFIEANLHNAIGVRDVADHAGYSQFYFSREFSKCLHISVYDYILKRKLSASYKDLFETGDKIVDVAFRYGFQSHEVYSRAFRKMFGENPSQAGTYKPLAVLQAVDDRYLSFLMEARIQQLDEAIKSSFFEINTRVGSQQSGCLRLLAKENCFDCVGMYHGSLRQREEGALAFRLGDARRVLRVEHADEAMAFRFFIEQSYEPDELTCNFILSEQTDSTIDYIVPVKHT